MYSALFFFSFCILAGHREETLIFHIHRDADHVCAFVASFLSQMEINKPQTLVLNISYRVKSCTKKCLCFKMKVNIQNHRVSLISMSNSGHCFLFVP